MINTPITSRSHDWQRTNSQKARLRTITRASLYLNGALFLLTYLPMAERMALVLAWIAVVASLIGIAALAVSLRLDCKH